MTKIFYGLFIKLYPLFIKTASALNQKAALWTKGRQQIFERLRQTFTSDAPVIWMHCSSLGEFEQGRPLLEKLKINFPSYKILLTFFSPSGYEVRKNFEGADYIFYLPMDSSGNAVKFFDIVKPRLVVFVKYEFWYHYLREAKQQNVPLLLISAIFRKQQPFFKSWGGFHRSMLSCFSHVFVQNSESLSLLKSAGFTDCISVSGDTRFDRVIEIAEKFQPVPVIEKFCSGSNVIVAGSTWTEDDKELAHFANTNPSVRFIIAPHSIIKDRLKECLHLYKNAALFSDAVKSPVPAGINAIIIDNIGMLSSLYKYSTIAYIGGGFGADGVHNVLEAAVYGRPVVFGPEYYKFFEAKELIEAGGAKSIDNAVELEEVLSKLLIKDEDYIGACKASYDYVNRKKGATEKILQFIQENRLLTN